MPASRADPAARRVFERRSWPDRPAPAVVRGACHPGRSRRSARAALARPLQVWLKLDSGMHRVGLHPATIPGDASALLASGKVGKIVLMSHFARADELTARAVPSRWRFRTARGGCRPRSALRNSPAILGWPPSPATGCARHHALRRHAGLPRTIRAARLRPVMTLESKVISVRELPAG